MRAMTLAGAAAAVDRHLSLRLGRQGAAGGHQPVSLRARRIRRSHSLRDDAVYPHINRADYAHTIYPPAAQMIFALAAAVTPGVFGMKLMMALFDALAIGALAWLLPIAGRDPIANC